MAKCVLIVDDEQSSLALQALIVERFGFKTITASSGYEALKQLARADLVITDVNMPGMDGITLCRAIKSRCQVPVIVVSAGEYYGEAVEAGATVFIRRPFMVPVFKAQIHELLGVPCLN